ncbi:MAG: tRNA (5-methylaminomethyl-2-thiouridine)(34)-methyltransferase MnmD [Alcaligenaceae bacterium]|nr:tRNA (5-methylaminomethyl-2-thiouridine)(34)-methyltransferase MnmD [Alcaligenaceae bacterium]
MTGNYEPLQLARIELDARGIPRSDRYGDVYHSASGAIGQATHVFLGGNDLPGRWRDRQAFTICETGFGLGQNFLVAWHAWRTDPARSARLHYLAFEAHPFTQVDLANVLISRLPSSYGDLARELCHAWPAVLPGLHRLEFDGGAVTLTLAFGTVRRLARQVQARVDAFFLDGFSPRLNPEMWSPALFGQLRRLARSGATAATWCSAGQVRRDLRNAGFLVDKAPGFGDKRDMTRARLRPGLGGEAAGRPGERIAIVGGGLAAGGIAQALALRGYQLDVYDPAFLDGPAAPRWPVWRAALVPALTPDDDTRARLSRVGLERARARWLALPGAARPDACGALVCAITAGQARLQQGALERLDFPLDWVRWLGAGQASERAGVSLSEGGLWFPEALRVCPDALLGALFSLPGAQRHAVHIAGLRANSQGGWQLLADDGRVCAEADRVVLANAYGARDLLAAQGVLEGLPKLGAMERLAGQISYFPLPDGPDVAPHCILSGNGYVLPPRNGVGIAGSTYLPESDGCRVNPEGHAAIAEQLVSWLVSGPNSWLRQAPCGGWSSWRAAVNDHLPMIGEVPGLPGVWLACAYGSRGLSWSALAGDVLGASFDAEPLPLERELLHRIRPR